ARRRLATLSLPSGIAHMRERRCSAAQANRVSPKLLPNWFWDQGDLVVTLSACDKIAMPKTKTKAASTNIYAVLGSDEAEVKRVAAELASNLTPAGAGDFGLEVIDGAADNVDQVGERIRPALDAMQTLHVD